MLDSGGTSMPGTLRFRMILIALPALLAPWRASAQEMAVYAISDWSYYNTRAWRWIDAGELEKAERALGLAIKAIRPLESTHRRLLARSYRDLAWVLYLEKRAAQAEPLCKWALDVFKADKRVTQEAMFQTLFTLALIERELKKPDAALPLLTQALDLQHEVVGANHPATTETLDELAAVYLEKGDATHAEWMLRREAAILQQLGPSAQPALAHTLELEAGELKKLGRKDEAAVMLERVANIKEALAERPLGQKKTRQVPKLVSATSRVQP